MIYVELEEYKTANQITDTGGDERIKKILYYASAYFDLKTKSHIDKQSHDTLFDGDDSMELLGLHRPIITLTLVKIDGVDVIADVVTYKNEGKLYYANGFTAGKQNIQIKYDAGYVDANGVSVVPDAVQLAVMQIANVFRQKMGKEMIGSFNTLNGDSFQFFDKEMPDIVKSIIADYARSERVVQSNQSLIYVV